MVTILGPLDSSGVKLPLFSFHVPAGFPSPASDHLEKRISLDELLDERAHHIYLVRVYGPSTLAVRPDEKVLPATSTGFTMGRLR